MSNGINIMNLETDRRELWASVVLLLASFAGGGLMLVLATAEGNKVLWRVMCVAICLFIARLSGNPRLSCLSVVAIGITAVSARPQSGWLQEAPQRGGVGFRKTPLEPLSKST